MMMETMNLAATWNLPTLFVCKDDNWSITTDSNDMTGGTLTERAHTLGLSTYDVDGRDVQQVWDVAHEALAHLRAGKGPVFLHATCIHLEGHFLGYQLLRAIRNPLREMPSIAAPLIGSFVRPGGANLGERLAGMRIVMGQILGAIRDPRQDKSNDPVKRARNQLMSEPERLEALESAVREEIEALVHVALEEVPA
jgi:TPP-dependent pyruvate/acetoin dehydrogenase alpha subunit